jgi:muramoyltetrapeptide carboxypeptidase
MNKFSIKKTILPILSILIFTGCTKEYITNEYNEYVTHEHFYEYYYSNEYYSTILSSQQEIKTDIRPPYLQPGDSVAICATSNYVTRNEIADAKTILEGWGLKVAEAENLYDVDGRYAGTVDARRRGLQKMIDNPNIKAIIAARGGYGAIQIINYVDLRPLEFNPKWIVGFSDVTVLHAALNNKGIETIHGCMANNFSNANSVNSLKSALFGEMTELSIPTNTNCIKGIAEGRLVGGNLSIIYSLGGVLSFDLNTKGAILFFEDTGEANYAIDRMLSNLKLSGKLDSVKGIIIGQFTNMTAGQDKPLEEIIAEKVRDLGIPVMYGISAGHGNPNLSLYLGRTIELNVGDDTAALRYLN